MRRVYRQGFHAKAAFRRGAVVAQPRADVFAPEIASSTSAAETGPRKRGRVRAFIIRVARAIFRRAKPALTPIAFRVRHFLFTEQVSQLEAMRRDLDEGRLMTATWANEEQLKFAARIIGEVQSSRRMILDRSAIAAAAQTNTLAVLAADIASIRAALGTTVASQPPGLIDVTLAPGATVVHVGAAAAPVLEYFQRKVGLTGRVAALGPTTNLDGLFGEGVVDALRIDAPGHELSVLRGVRRSLARHADVFMMVRFDRVALQQFGVSLDTWLAAFAELGLQGRVASSDGNALLPATAASLEQVEFCEMLFSRPRL